LPLSLTTPKRQYARPASGTTLASSVATYVCGRPPGQSSRLFVWRAAVKDRLIRQERHEQVGRLFWVIEHADECFTIFEVVPAAVVSRRLGLSGDIREREPPVRMTTAERPILTPDRRRELRQAVDRARRLRLREAGYSTAAWQTTRKYILARDGHVCQVRGPRCTGVATSVRGLACLEGRRST
jgi:hypothetical protein